MPTNLYLGLMSGTSADGVDIALLTFEQAEYKLIASDYYPYTEPFSRRITQLYQSQSDELELAASLDIELAEFFADCVLNFLAKNQLHPEQITAIGNHGQTIRHRPNLAHAFSCQLGSNTVLAVKTGIRVIGQFRQKDIALGGQGAPLIPKFHQYLLESVNNSQAAAFLNIGGIANMTVYQPDTSKLLGFDTGPGNGLLDAWFVKHHPDHSLRYDQKGSWASTGTINQALLTQLLTDDYFQLAAPKSTGREYFNLAWLEAKLAKAKQYLPEDIQATLVALTAQTIADAFKRLSFQGNIFLLGGGCYNHCLIAQLKALLPQCHLQQANFNGINVDNMEASCFAWLAHAYDKKIYSNNPDVTGACRATVLGVEFLP